MLVANKCRASMAQAGITRLVIRDRRHQPNAHAEFDIRLDHVSVHRSQHHVRHQRVAREGLVDVAAAGVTALVGDERELGQPRQRQYHAAVGLLRQRVVARHNDDVRPAITRQRHQILVTRQRFGGDADVGLPIEQHLRDLARRALVELQHHVRVRRAEIANGGWQGVARLRMRRGDGERAAVLRGEVGAGALEVVRLDQQSLDDRQHHLAGWREPGEPLAGAHEDLDAEFLLQFADLPAHAGLRGVQDEGDFGEVEALADGFAHGAQLLEVHRAIIPAPASSENDS
jgi:hypothetical protein